MIYVLDASALLRFLLGQEGDRQVESILQDARQAGERVLISALNWGECVGKIFRLNGSDASDALFPTMRFHGLEIIPLSPEAAARAAVLKVKLLLGYADAVCLELAISHPGSTLVTADNDFRIATALATIHLLPSRARP